MKSLSHLIEPFVYDKLDRLLYEYEKSIYNVSDTKKSFLNDTSGFSLGNIIKAATLLYIYEKRKNGKKTEEYKRRMITFFAMVKSDSPLETWGKIFVLCALKMLFDDNCMNVIGQDAINILKIKTDYRDFISTERMEFLKPLPSNYIHVALECAVLREKIGFENEDMSHKLLDKLIDTVEDFSTDGWLDEQPPFGRFDIYSLSSNSAIIRLFEMMERDVPDCFKKNEREIIDILYALRNRQGKGFYYGRSVAFFADKFVVEKLLSAIKKGLIDDDKTDEVMTYVICVAERIINFWYDQKREICNLWFDGRNTENYRPLSKAFSVTLELLTGLADVAENMKETLYYDYIPKKDITDSQRWEINKTVFVDEEKKVRKLYVLRRKEHTFVLNLTGLGKRIRSAAYMPAPREADFLDAPPADVCMPYLCPRVTLFDGTVVMPVQNYYQITEIIKDDYAEIVAKGRLADISDNTFEKVSDKDFEVRYIFNKDIINVEYKIKGAVDSKIVFCGGDVSYVTFPDATGEIICDTSKNHYFDSYGGNLSKCKIALISGEVIRYEIKL